MQLQVKGSGVSLTPSLRAYAQSRLARLDRQLPPDTAVALELTEETKHARRTVAASIVLKGAVLRARESTSDARASIDHVVDSLERQLVKQREKRRREPRRRTAHHGA